MIASRLPGPSAIAFPPSSVASVSPRGRPPQCTASRPHGDCGFPCADGLRYGGSVRWGLLLLLLVALAPGEQQRVRAVVEATPLEQFASHAAEATAAIFGAAVSIAMTVALLLFV